MGREDVRRTDRPGNRDARRAVVVIADDGSESSIVVLRLPTGDVVGSRFTHDDRAWIVTEPRPGTRVFFAAPSEV